MENLLSLYELNQHIRQALELNFDERIWVQCEIAQIGQSRGHHYVTLVQKSPYGDQILAQSQAVIWKGNFEKLRLKHRDLLQDVLQEGAEVSLLIKVDFHERYGLKLLVEGIDPSYTLGQLALQKQQALEKLIQEKLLDKNKSVFLPTVVQHVAILSSETAAGYIDFVEQLRHNSYAYDFHMHLFPVAVQGQNLVPEFLIQLERIYKRKHDFDLIVVVRGGGGKMDLGGFDDYKLCQMVANAPLAVICGIGHDIDESLLDLVAHSSLKTPTAVADFIVEHNMHYEAEMLKLARAIRQEANWIINREWESLIHLSRDVHQLSLYKIRQADYFLERRMSEIFALLKGRFSEYRAHLNTFGETLSCARPEATLCERL